MLTVSNSDGTGIICLSIFKILWPFLWGPILFPYRRGHFKIFRLSYASRVPASPNTIQTIVSKTRNLDKQDDNKGTKKRKKEKNTYFTEYPKKGSIN